MSTIDAETYTIPSAPNELWYTRCAVPTAFEVALGNGAFEDEFARDGLSWLPIAQSPDPAVHESHFTHRKANSFRHGGNIPPIHARSRGADTAVIGLSWPRTSCPVLVLPESDIASAADLEGRRLLVARCDQEKIDFWAASTLRTWESALASVGLTLDDAEVVETLYEEHELPGLAEADLQGRQRWQLRLRGQMVRALIVPLLRGEVDAIVGQSTLAEEIQTVTDARVIYDQADQADVLARVNNSSPDILTVSGELVREHPERVARVVARLLDAADWARSDPQAALELLSHRLQQPTALLEATYGDRLIAHLDLSLPPETADILQVQQDLLLRHGFITDSFDVAEWIDPRPLQLAQGLRAVRAAA